MFVSYLQFRVFECFRERELFVVPGLCWFSPAVLPTLLPAVDMADTLGLNLVADLTSSLSQSDEGVTGERREAEEHIHIEPPVEVLKSVTPEQLNHLDLSLCI